jgi:hypothetical protein
MLALFKSCYSIGKSILTLDDPKKTSPEGSDSIFKIALENDLKEIILVEDSLIGFFEAFKRSKELKLKLIFGLRLSMRNSSLPEVAGDAAIYVDEYDVTEMIQAIEQIQIPIVRQQQQTPRVFVEAAHRKNPLGIAHIVHHVAANALVGRRGHPLWLIEQQVHGAWLGTRRHLLPVELHFIAVPNRISKNSNPAVDPHGPRLNSSVRFAPATDAVAAYVLIKANPRLHVVSKVGFLELTAGAIQKPCAGAQRFFERGRGECAPLPWQFH